MNLKTILFAIVVTLSTLGLPETADAKSRRIRQYRYHHPAQYHRHHHHPHYYYRYRSVPQYYYGGSRYYYSYPRYYYPRHRGFYLQYGPLVIRRW